MKRQVLLIDYFGDKSIEDELVVKIGRTITTMMDDHFQVKLFSESDIDKLLIQTIKTSQSVIAPLIPSELVKAVDYVQSVIGKPENTNNKTGETVYIEKTYKAFVEMFMSHGDKKRLYKNAIEIILRYTKIKNGDMNKIGISYLRDRGFTSRIIDTLTHQYDYLVSC